MGTFFCTSVFVNFAPGGFYWKAIQSIWKPMVQLYPQSFLSQHLPAVIFEKITQSITMEYWNLRFNLKMGPALFRRCVLETIIFRFSVSLDVWGTLKQLWRRYQCQFSCFTWFTVPPYDERHKSVQPKEHFLSIARLDIKCGEPLCGITLQESVSITSTGALFYRIHHFVSLSRQVQETLWNLSIGHGAMVEWCILQAALPKKTTQYNGGGLRYLIIFLVHDDIEMAYATILASLSCLPSPPVDSLISNSLQV